MQKLPFVPAAIAAAVWLLAASPAIAQPYETVGTRAQGMAGAFVAVADDASATWWNPAGLASAAYFSATLERGRIEQPTDVPSAGPARRDTVSGFALGFPSLGLSYYRLRISEIAPTPATASAASDRQDQQATGVSIRSLEMTQFGISVGQSVGNHLVVASTLSLMRGGAVAGTDAANGSGSLGRAADLDVPGETHGDLDVGVIAPFGIARFGLTVKHVAQPSFGDGAARFDLKRQTRAGFAILGHSSGAIKALTLAVDADLTRIPTVFGDSRRLAGGAEAWMLENHFGVRGGFSRSTVGATRAAGSVGASIGIRAGVYVDGALTNGSDRSLNGWSVALRVTRF